VLRAGVGGDLGPRPGLAQARPDGPGRRTARLWAVLSANVALVGALAVAGANAHSVAVFAEAVDYLGDAAAIGISLFAIYLSRRPPTSRHPQGHPRATRFAAAVNAGWLLALCLVVAAEAIYRLATGVHEVHGLLVLVASGLAAVVMTGGALLLRGANGEGSVDAARSRGTGLEHHDLNFRAVLLDTAADAAAAAGVAVTGAVIFIARGLYWLDPVVALGVAVVVGYHVVHLLAEIVDTREAPSTLS
jgi:cobalt-zinc-cadmium efflux system protein